MESVPDTGETSFIVQCGQGLGLRSVSWGILFKVLIDSDELCSVVWIFEHYTTGPIAICFRTGMAHKLPIYSV